MVVDSTSSADGRLECKPMIVLLQSLQMLCCDVAAFYHVNSGFATGILLCWALHCGVVGAVAALSAVALLLLISNDFRFH
jgi:hypothetical protein